MFGWKMEEGILYLFVAQMLLPRNYKNLLPVDASQSHRVPGIIAVAGQLVYHVLRTASVKRKNTV